jgi:hypothetical protein
MATQDTSGQKESVMKRNQFKIRVAVVVSAIIASLAISAGAQAVRPPEPSSNARGIGVKHTRTRKVAKLSTAGRPDVSGVHVKSAAELRTE